MHWTFVKRKTQLWYFHFIANFLIITTKNTNIDIKSEKSRVEHFCNNYIKQCHGFTIPNKVAYLLT